MNGLQYHLPSFTLPAGSHTTAQVNWDFAFLSKAEFVKKYGISEYNRFVSGKDNR